LEIVRQFKACIITQIRQIILEGLDQRIERLNTAKDIAAKPSRGWLRAIREAIGLTQGAVAARVSVKRQTYAQFELAEEKGAISLSSLQRAAEAMDCELIYFVVPRGSTSRTFGDLARARDPLSPHAAATDQSMALKADPPRE
jgi:predicted DNA-binding mobile mystery protein A